MRKLFIYPNCSNGGVTAVLRARANAEPDVEFIAVFAEDRGGKYAYEDIQNLEVRIAPQGRMNSFLQYITKNFEFDAVSVLSSPSASNLLSKNDKLAVDYEFHSSNMSIVEREISELDLDLLGSVVVPSEEMRVQLKDRLPKRIQGRLHVVPNMVDSTVFHEGGSADLLNHLGDSEIPLIWVGRLEAPKGMVHFARLIAELPEQYIGYAVVSLEKDVSRFERFWSECDALGIRTRMHLMMDVSQPVMAELYRSARDRDGYFVSTSLMESFGYAASESLACGLKGAAFDLPVWSRFADEPRFTSVDTGDVQALARVIAAQ